MSMTAEQKTKVKCKKCDYEFETTSKLDNVTCPNCGRKTPRVEAPTRKVK